MGTYDEVPSIRENDQSSDEALIILMTQNYSGLFKRNTIYEKKRILSPNLSIQGAVFAGNKFIEVTQNGRHILITTASLLNGGNQPIQGDTWIVFDPTVSDEHQNGTILAKVNYDEKAIITIGGEVIGEVIGDDNGRAIIYTNLSDSLSTVIVNSIFKNDDQGYAIYDLGNLSETGQV